MTAQAPESNASGKTRTFIRKLDEPVRTIRLREMPDLSTAEVQNLQDRFEALRPRKRYLIQDILNVGAQVGAVTSQFQRLGWTRIRNAPLLVLLALNPARKNEGSTAVALAWYFGANMVRAKSRQDSLLQAEGLDAVPELYGIDASVRDYLSSHFPELLKKLDDVTDAAKPKLAPAEAGPEKPKSSMFSGNPFLDASSEEVSDQEDDLEV